MAIIRITALWAFSESVLGGILHAFSIPFSGALLSGFAVILISLLSLFSSRGEILKASIIVVLIKASISPYVPLTAHVAVLMQGLLGEVFFFSKKFFKTSAILFAITVVVLSGAQRILTLTIVFGNTLWNSIDTYSRILISEFFGKNSSQDFVSVSLLIISAYILLHFLIGLIFGYAAGKLPEWINRSISEKELTSFDSSKYGEKFPEIKRERKRWWNKKPGKIFLTVVLILVVYSYFHPELGKEYSIRLIIMLVRSFVILFLWFTLVSPLLYKAFRKIIDKKQINYFSQTEKIISTFPELKKILFFNWKRSQKLKGYSRIKFFVTSTLIMGMFYNSNVKISHFDTADH